MTQDQPVPVPGKGTKLAGRYTLGVPISSGGMGAVFAGRDERDGVPVAIKRMVDPRFAVRFAIEARLLAQLGHPRVVRVRDNFEDATGMYLVMDLVRGTDLGRALEERGSPGLPLAEAVSLTLEACEALQYVHDQQIIHRDVKPQNLILGEAGVVLVDFGVAREVGPSDATIGIGTPRFMAPEVLAGGSVSPRSDVFGLASTLWNLLTGELPAYGRTDSLAELVPDAGPDLRAALAAGLEIIPERRISSAAAFARALGARLGPSAGVPLALSVDTPAASRSLLEAVVRTAAGVFDAASASIALEDQATGELVYQAAWGSGAREIVGVRLERGRGISGSVIASGQPLVVPDCRGDSRFAVQVATGTGYVPNTMLVAPLMRGGQVTGTLSLLDRRDGESYGLEDQHRATLFADLAVAALGADEGHSVRGPTAPASQTMPGNSQ